MLRRACLTVAIVGGAWSSLAAQVTGTPSFNAPYRAFSRHEFGGTISFPSGQNLGLEGQYRFGYQRFDVGLRGGFVDPGGAADAIIVVGAEGRSRLIEHTESFPLDGALIVGLGGNFTSGSSQAIILGGLSLGRRIDPANSQVSIIPYAEPALFITSGGGAGTDLSFALGVGADFRLSSVFDARVSVAFGDVEGIAFSAVWVR
jgi:hypothetical protein